MKSWKQKLTAFLLCAAMLLCCGAAQAEDGVTEGTTVYVTNVDEFLAAIAPDTQIVLAPGEYNLTKAKNYSRGGSDWYHWESVFDGWELVITDLTGLTIRGESYDTATISTEPRYANVLNFVNASDIHIAELTVGHTKEQGSCRGGVLFFDTCQDVEIQSSRLYGCGTLGISLEKCRNVHVDDSDIYECSEGCVSIEGSYNVLFENSKFYNCRLWDGVFRIISSQEVAVINSEVFGNTSQEESYFENNTCLVYSNCQGIYLGGLDVHDNSFLTLFNTGNYPVVLEKSRLDVPIGDYGSTPVSPEGEELTPADINNMSMRIVQWSPAEITAMPEIEPSADGKIHVTNVEEFLGAIGSNRTIFLEPGIYDLSTASNYGSLGGEYYSWEPVYDGAELCISDVGNLTIEGADTAQVSILAIPRYANVLRFDNTHNLTLRNFTAGHSQEPGECSGGVIKLNYATNTTIEGCSLYGCGIIGIWATACRSMDVINTEIYECSQNGAVFSYCSGVNLSGCNIHDNGGVPVSWDGIGGVTVDGESPYYQYAATPIYADLPTVEPSEDGKIHVSTVDEFLGAIDSNVTIYLEPGIYDLTTASSYGGPGGAFFTWEPVFDGMELCITGVVGLTIEGADTAQVTVCTTPRYANVLRFDNSMNLTLRNFTAGHTPEPGYCTGGVLQFNFADNTTIEGCSLYGCGIVGIWGTNCVNMDVYKTEIYDCSEGAAWFFDCDKVGFFDCNIHHNGGSPFLFDGSGTLTVDGVEY